MERNKENFYVPDGFLESFEDQLYRAIHRRRQRRLATYVVSVTLVLLAFGGWMKGVGFRHSPTLQEGIWTEDVYSDYLVQTIPCEAIDELYRETEQVEEVSLSDTDEAVMEEYLYQDGGYSTYEIMLNQ